MNIHENARTTFRGRVLMVKRIREEGWRVADAARAAGISERRAYAWLARHRAGGEPALHDRSSAPARCQRRTPVERVAKIERLRRQRMSGPAIARALAMPRSTVGAHLRRLGLSRISALDPKPAVVRYERDSPGELIHMDTKKLARIDAAGHRVTGDKRDSTRGAGYEVVHVAIDDHSRVATTDVLPDEKKESAIAFLLATLAYYKSFGVTVDRVMTDNGSCYRSKAFRRTCEALRVRHIFTKPYTPRTNGKAERFIQTSLREWAYVRAYETSSQREQALDPWLHAYNHTRPHSALGGRPPASRLNNLRGFDS